MLFVCAGRIGRSIRLYITRFNQAIAEQIIFHFLTADGGQHLAVDFDTGGEGLAGLFYHLSKLVRLIDDISILELEIIFPHDGPYARAPAAGWF